MTRSRSRRKRVQSRKKPEQAPPQSLASSSRSSGQPRPPIPRFSDLNTSPELPAVNISHRIASQATGVARRRTTLSAFAGPLPPPELLLRYNLAVPDAADRILRMAEEQAHHRQKLETMDLMSGARRANWGLAAGLIVALAFLVGSVILGLNGHDALAGGLGGATLVGLVTAFVTGTVSRQRERRQSLQDLEKRRTASNTPRRESRE